MAEIDKKFDLWAATYGPLDADEEGLPATVDVNLQPVGNGQLTFLAGRMSDLNRTHRRAIGISEEIEAEVGVSLLLRVAGAWNYFNAEKQWKVLFGANLNQWDIRKNGKWYRRKVK